jgi:hypothetical protein
MRRGFSQVSETQKYFDMELLFLFAFLFHVECAETQRCAEVFDRVQERQRLWSISVVFALKFYTILFSLHEFICWSIVHNLAKTSNLKFSSNANK